MVGYNLLFYAAQRRISTGAGNVDRNIFLQVLFDLIALTLLLYYAGSAAKPVPVLFRVSHDHRGHVSARQRPVRDRRDRHGDGRRRDAAVCTCNGFRRIRCIFRRILPCCRRPTGSTCSVSSRPLPARCGWRSTSLRRSAATSIVPTPRFGRRRRCWASASWWRASPIKSPTRLDGVQNCLRRIGERVKDDPHLTEYVQLMAEALDRIERTAKRVQAFARPRGITLQSTDVNQAIEATFEVLGTSHGRNIRIEKELGAVAAVQGDPYTLQEVLFNLCTNALNAMPKGGTLTLAKLRRWAARTKTRWARWPSTSATRASAFRGSIWSGFSSRFSPPAPIPAAPASGWGCAAC